MPHLATGARLELAVKMQLGLWQGRNFVPGRLAFGRPDITEDVPHGHRSMESTGTGRQATNHAHLLFELGSIAGVDRVMPRVVRTRRHLVNQHLAIGSHKELNCQNPTIAQAFGNALGGIGRDIGQFG